MLAVGFGITLIFGYPFHSVITDNSSSEKTGPDLTRLESILAGAIDGKRIIDADREPGSWLSHARTYDEQRFSPLTQVNADNAGQLGLAWYFDTGDVIVAQCYNWQSEFGKKNNFKDSLTIGISNKDIDRWFSNEAYN